jgi:hypothetical protein
MKNHHSRTNNQQNGNANQSLMICNKCINKKFTSKKALQLHQIRTHSHTTTTTTTAINDRYLR